MSTTGFREDQSSDPAPAQPETSAGVAVTDTTLANPSKPATTTVIDPHNPSIIDERPFSAFSNKQKWNTVLLASIGAMYSPISSNIYVPALPQVAADFHKSTQQINLTLTVFLVFQATSPAIIAGLSDSIGRRPVILLTLSLYCIACVAIALCPASQYGLLLFFRCVQAIGGSPMIAIGNGTIGDFATPQERGKFMGLFSGVAMIGPAMGPVLGGILVQYLSWRWIFWVLAIMSGVTILMIFVWLPETLRAIVGDGSIPPPMINARPADHLRRRRRTADEEAHEKAIVRPEKKKYDPLASWKMLFHPEVALVLTFASMCFGAIYAVLTSYSTLLEENYHFSELKTGLCYLSQGGGSMLAGILGGRLLDWDFRRAKKRLNFQPKHPRDVEGFPLERVRFKNIPIFLALFVGGLLGYGWGMDKRASIAVSLVMNVFIGVGNQVSMQICTCLLVDMFPMAGGAVNATFNLTRCGLGAIMSAIIDPLMKTISIGFAFTLIAGLCVATWPCTLVLQVFGPAWRTKRIRLAAEAAGRRQEKKRLKVEKD